MPTTLSEGGAQDAETERDRIKTEATPRILFDA